MKHDLEKIVTIDFETYYDSDFSLSNKDLNTSDYIRDSRFKVHCIGIKIGSDKAYWYDEPTGREVLASIDWTTHAALAHNMAFDGMIMSTHYGIVPSYYYDTLSMTRGLHNEVSRAKLDTIAKFYGIGAKHEGALANTKGKVDLDENTLILLGEYCSNDVELCYEVFVKQAAIYPEMELDLIDLTMRMFCDPVLVVDTKRVEAELHREVAEKERLIEASGATREELNSNAKFAERLKALGITPPTKISLRTGQENFAFAQTDPEFIELLEHEDVAVVRLAEARLAAKSTIGETRAQRFINAGRDGHRLPIMLNYYGAKTGRWSGGNKMNMQNLPRGGELRKSILAPKDHVIVVVDSAQIEARVNAWLAGETAVVEAFAAGADIYKIMASHIYGIPVEEVDKDQRFVGKVAVLGLGYGMGAKKFQTTLALGMMGPPVDLPLEMCQNVVNLYRNTNSKIVDQWRELQNCIVRLIRGDSGVFADLMEYENNTFWLPNGMPLNYPGLSAEINMDTGKVTEYRYRAFDMWKKIYGGLLCENIVQALARIIVAEQMLEIAKNWRVVTMTHDEVVAIAHKSEADACLNNMLETMKTPPAWAAGCPVNCEGGYAENYSK